MTAQTSKSRQLGFIRIPIQSIDITYVFMKPICQTALEKTLDKAKTDLRPRRKCLCQHQQVGAS
jgi:hypothetical protein